MEARLFSYALVYAAFLPLLAASYWFLDRMLVPRSRLAVRAVQAAVAIFSLLPVGDSTTIVTNVVICLVMPFALYRGGLRDRALVSMLSASAATTAELMGLSVWMLLTGGLPTVSWEVSWAHYLAHAASSLFSAVVLFAVLAAFSRQLGYARETLTGHAPLIALLGAQSVALFILSKAAMVEASSDASLYWGLTVLCALCLVADVEVFRAAGRLRVIQDEERRAAELSRSLDELSERTREEIGALTEAAILRHDARNNLALVRSLVERGELVEAARLARGLAREAVSHGD